MDFIMTDFLTAGFGCTEVSPLMIFIVILDWLLV